MEHPLRELKMKKGHAGEEPRWWKEDGVPKCNVVGINWHGGTNKSWYIEWRNANGKRQSAHEKEFGAALAFLRSKPPDGKSGPGELAVHEGELVVTKCARHLCTRVMLPAIEFCPDPNANKDRCYRYTKALEAILKSPGGDTTAHIATICGLKQHWCFYCRGSSKKSHREGENSIAACYRAAAEIRADMARRGCAICGFKECLECDHGGRQDKEFGVLNPIPWASKYGHDGPAMMWREYRKKCIQVLCMNCHVMEPSHNAVKGADSATLAKGSKAKRQREYNEAKTRYNNGRKCAVGKCHYCAVECVEGNERMFVWMHKDEIGKTVAVSGIVGNGLHPDTGNPIIDAIIDGGQVLEGDYSGEHQGSGCRLGCHNCHYKHETVPRRKIGVALFDKLWGVPIKCTTITPTTITTTTPTTPAVAPGEPGPSNAPIAQTAPVPPVVVGIRVAKRPLDYVSSDDLDYVSSDED
jgi:hypothetical protein